MTTTTPAPTPVLDAASAAGKLYADAAGKLLRVDDPVDTPYVFGYLYKPATDSFGTRRLYRATATLSAI